MENQINFLQLEIIYIFLFLVKQNCKNNEEHNNGTFNLTLNAYTN